MEPIASVLRQEGYQVENWNYPTFKGLIEHYGDELKQKLNEYEQDENIDRVHIVAHSMGGIISRYALKDGLTNKFHRLLMIATPNRGSYFATALKWMSPFPSRMIKQMAHTKDSFVNQLPKTIEDNRGKQHSFESGLLLAKYDYTVPKSLAKYEGINVTAIVPGSHSSTLINKKTYRQILRFLDVGEFYE